MTLRLRVLTVTFGMLICLAAIQPAPASAQRVSIGVGVGVGFPGYPVGVGVGVHYPYYRGYRYGYPWYPYAGYPYYPYPYPHPYGYAQIYPYPYYDPYGGLRLQVSPRQTEVFVDGYFAGVVDNFDGTFQRLDLAPGEHDLEFYLPGHQAVHQRLYLQPGKTSRVKLAMQPLAAGQPEPVRPSAQPLPPPPAPQQQGSAQGNPPPPRNPPSGAQPRRPQGPGPGPAQPPPGNTVEVAPAPAAPVGDTDFGGLALRVQPGSATILVDGERWDGPEGSERLVLQLAPGRHVVEVQKDGYRRYTTEVTVRPGETLVLNVALTKQ